MLQAILGTHRDVYTCSEPWVALPFLYALKEGGSEFEFDGRLAKDAIKSFFQESGIDQKFYNSALNSFLTSLYQKALTNSGKRVFLDKTPRYYEIASDLIKIFPDAKFVIIYRHPLSVLSSILTTWVKDDIEKLFYYSRDLLVGPRKLNEFVSAHKDKICAVKYEDIVSFPEIEIKKICKYINIEFIENILNYKTDVDWTYGDKYFKNKNTPDTQSLNSWKKGLSNKLTTNLSYYYFKELGEELINSIGYDYSSTMDEISKFNPSNSDYKIWDTLLNNKNINRFSKIQTQTERNYSHDFTSKIIKLFKR